MDAEVDVQVASNGSSGAAAAGKKRPAALGSQVDNLSAKKQPQTWKANPNGSRKQ